MPKIILPVTIKAAMIDLDGTLLDTRHGLALAINRMLVELSWPPLKESRVTEFVGKGVFNLVKRALADVGGKDPEQALFDRAISLFMDQYDRTCTEGTRPYPGVIEGLNVLHAMKLPLACVTNTIERFTMPLLGQYALEKYFREIICGDTLPKKKPDPLPLMHVAMKFGFATTDVLMIGDSLNDVEAARNAQCPVFCVDYGYTEGHDVRTFNVDAIVGSLLEVSKLIIRSE